MTGLYSPKHFLLKALSNYYTFFLLTAGFFTFERSWNLSTNFSWNYTSCSAYLWEGLIKNKGGVGYFQISEKERLFISYNNQMLLEVISQCGPFLITSKERFPLSFTLTKKRTYLDTQLKRELTYLFLKIPGCSLTHTQNRNRIMNNFITVNITPTCKR